MKLPMNTESKAMYREFIVHILNAVTCIPFYHIVKAFIQTHDIRNPMNLISLAGLLLLSFIAFVLLTTYRDRKLYHASLIDPTPLELKTMSPKQIALYSLFLTRSSSRLVGFVMSMQLPRILRKPLYSFVASKLGINSEEFAGDYEDYLSPNAFFTRDLKEGARMVVKHGDILVSPCDCTVSCMEEQTVTTPDIQAHQVKGIRYRLTDFLGMAIPYKKETNLLYTVTLYLSPSDYHHVHSPTYFTVAQRKHFPGKLLPVKASFVKSVKDLFTINERVVLTGEWKEGFFSMGLVGAYNVGSISLSIPEDADLRTNKHRKGQDRKKNMCYQKTYLSEVHKEPGDRVGTFHLGSTVVLAFESPQFTWLVKPGDKVKMGQPIGFVNQSHEVEDLCHMDTVDIEDSTSSDQEESVYSECSEGEELDIEDMEIENMDDFEEISLSQDSSPSVGEIPFLSKIGSKYRVLSQKLLRAASPN